MAVAEREGGGRDGDSGINNNISEVYVCIQTAVILPFRVPYSLIPTSQI